MSGHKSVGLRIDVDTLRGTREGVLRLCEVFDKHAVRGSFFFTLGPDNSGKAIWNVFRQKGFLKKMLRTNALALYGWGTITSGLFGKAKEIGATCPESLRTAAKAGHETGFHAWDHRRWQDHVWNMKTEEIGAHYLQGFAEFERILGFKPKCAAAPSWRTSPDALAMQDGLGLDYASDIRFGRACFLSHAGRRFSTLQIPASSRCLEEYQTAGTGDEDDIIEGIVGELLKADCPTITVHAEVEGNIYAKYLDNLITRIQSRVGPLVPLGTIAAQTLKNRDSVPVFELSRTGIAGRSGQVSSAKGA